MEGRKYIGVSKFQGRRGNRATRSPYRMALEDEGGFGIVEIETCVLHVHHLHNGVKRGTFGIFSAL